MNLASLAYSAKVDNTTRLPSTIDIMREADELLKEPAPEASYFHQYPEVKHFEQDQKFLDELSDLALELDQQDTPDAA